MIGLWNRTRRTRKVPCVVDIEQTAESLHAHVALHGVEIGPGDRVLVHGAPLRVTFGQRVQCQRSASVTRASWLERLWIRFRARFDLSTLYEVGFQRGRDS